MVTSSEANVKIMTYWRKQFKPKYHRQILT